MAALTYPSGKTPVSPRNTAFPVKAQLHVNCGCGERYDDVALGIAHAETTGHTLHITGEIRAQRNW